MVRFLSLKNPLGFFVCFSQAPPRLPLNLRCLHRLLSNLAGPLFFKFSQVSPLYWISFHFVELGGALFPSFSFALYVLFWPQINAFSCVSRLFSFRYVNLCGPFGLPLFYLPLIFTFFLYNPLCVDLSSHRSSWSFLSASLTWAIRPQRQIPSCRVTSPCLCVLTIFPMWVKAAARKEKVFFPSLSFVAFRFTRGSSVFDCCCWLLELEFRS